MGLVRVAICDFGMASKRIVPSLLGIWFDRKAFGLRTLTTCLPLANADSQSTKDFVG
jgi:hypothetical protein